MKHWLTAAQILVLAVPLSVAAAQANPPRRRAATHAQRLVDRFVAGHPALSAVELAVDTGGRCRTIAATDPKDIGEACDADELDPMHTGQPNVEAPSSSDPVYDITLSLHDHAGRLIGAVGMDVKPAAGQDRATVLANARAVQRELEGAIPSKAWLLCPAGAP